VQQDQGDEGKAAVWLLWMDSTWRRKRVTGGWGRDGEQHALKGIAEEGSGLGVWLRATRRKVDGGVSQFSVVGRLQVVLSKVTARAHGGIGLVNRGAWRGARDVGRRGASD
jgi:hypothetical protein